MGSLAFWGGVAGAAQGMKENATRKADAEQSDLDHQRQMALERFRTRNTRKIEEMRQQGQSERAQLSADTSTTNTENQLDSRENMQTVQQGHQQSMQDDNQQHEMEMLQMRLENNLDVTALRQQASSAGARAALERFQPRVLKAGETNEFNVLVEHDTPAVFDKPSGRLYLQEGNRLFLAGGEENNTNTRRANPKAITALLQNPERGDLFLQEYGYLPIEYLGILNQAALGAYAQPEE